MDLSLWESWFLSKKSNILFMQLIWISSNLWKYFLIQFTNRRNFIPILSVYYLTLPHAQANEIGLYTGLWFTAAMLMQIPSGFIADHYWQKNTLIIAKILLIFSSIFYLIATNFWMFSIGAICMSLGLNAFATGTTSSFLKWTLEMLGRGKEFRVMASRISGNVSLVSILFVVGLPFLTTIDIKAPLYFWLLIDIFGLLIAFSLFPVHTKIKKEDKKWLFILIRELRWKWFFSYALFAAIITGFIFADNVYRSPYLTELGYPLAYIGLVMWWSRVVWWIVGRSIKTIEKYISFDRLIFIELFVFPIYYIGAGYITNPWMLGIVFSLIVWWFWWRNEVYTDYLIDHMADHRYRSTALSLKAQIENFVQIGVSFGIAGIMWISYQLGFQILGIVMFVLLFSIYFFSIRKNFSYTSESDITL